MVPLFASALERFSGIFRIVVLCQKFLVHIGCIFRTSANEQRRAVAHGGWSIRARDNLEACGVRSANGHPTHSPASQIGSDCLPLLGRVQNVLVEQQYAVGAGNGLLTMSDDNPRNPHRLDRVVDFCFACRVEVRRSFVHHKETGFPIERSRD